MSVYQWELKDQYGNERIGQSAAEDAQSLRQRLEEQGFLVDYVLDVSQGKQIAGTNLFYFDTLASTTTAAELVQECGFEQTPCASNFKRIPRWVKFREGLPFNNSTE